MVPVLMGMVNQSIGRACKPKTPNRPTALVRGVSTDSVGTIPEYMAVSALLIDTHCFYRIFRIFQRVASSSDRPGTG